MDHDLTTAPDTGAAARAAAGTPSPSRPRSTRGGIPGQAGAGAAAGDAGPDDSFEVRDPADSPPPNAPAPPAPPASPTGTVRLASPGSVIASIPYLFGFHPENSLVVLGISHSAEGGSFIRHGVRIDLDQVRGHERTTALELAARLRDQDADIAILVAFGPRGATGAKARPDHCRKLMAAFRAQLEAAASEERVTVVDALYAANGRWWSYMCRNNRCCPSAGTVVPAEAPAALAGAFAARGHTVYASREALDATLDPYPPEVLARTSAAVEHLDPTWYDTDAGLADARRLMDVLLARCGADSDGPAPRVARPEGPRAGRRGLSGNATAALSTRPAGSADASSSEHPGSQSSVTDPGAADGPASGSGGSGATGSDGSRQGGRTASPDAATAQGIDAAAAAAAAVDEAVSRANGTAPHSSSTVVPAARTSRRATNRVPAGAGLPEGALLAEPPGSLLAPPVISDAETAELLVALLNWRVRDYLACAAATVDSAGRLLRLGAELARRAPHPDLRLAPYALAAWAAWAISRPAIAQCAVDRALAIDPEYKFASLIRAGLHHAIDGEGVRESAASTRRDLFGETAADPDVPARDATDPDRTDPDRTDRDRADRDGADREDPGPDAAPASIPAPRSTKKVRTETETDQESP